MKSFLEKDIFRTQGVVALIIVFFLAFAPLLPSTSTYRGDESFYTFAAIRMLQTGDYFTPHYSDGSLRLHKPILIYWILAASYKVFGINFFSSRIPFLIAGCLIILLTYKLSLLFFRRTEWALIAAAVIASNLTLFHVSVRSTPDTFLCLFVSLSLYGFARLIFEQDLRMMNYLFAYIGAGLAVATKGGWGFLPVAFSFLFCIFRKKDTIRLRELIDVKSIAIALVIALFWYVIAYYRQGDIFVQQFFGDQVGVRLSGSKWYIAKNLLAYVFVIVREFAPWSFILILLLLINRDKDMLGNFFREHKEACIFIFGWYLSLCLIFSLGNIQRTRYLLPAYPLISALYAVFFVLIARRGTGLSVSILRYTERIVLLACFLLGLVMVLSGLFIDMRLIVGGVIAMCVAALIYVLLFRRGGVYGLVTFALCIILVYSVTENFISRVFSHSPASCVVDKVREHTDAPTKIAAVDFSPHYGAQIYVVSGGSILVEILPSKTALDKLRHYQFVLLSEQRRGASNLDGYAVEECSFFHAGKRFKVSSLWTIRSGADIRTLLSELQQHCYLLIKSEPQH